MAIAPFESILARGEESTALVRIAFLVYFMDNGVGECGGSARWACRTGCH